MKQTHPNPICDHYRRVQAECRSRDERERAGGSSARGRPVRTPDGDRIFFVDDVARMFNVSTKTITRWRKAGLVGQPFVVQGQRRFGFSKNSIDTFVRENSERIHRTWQFQPVTDAERQAIVNEARRLGELGRSRAEIMKQVAQQTNRSIETIRQTLKQFEQDHPNDAAFGPRFATLSDELKQQVYQRFHRGDSLQQMAREFRRP
jgi:RNA polymerase primary sigma factor/RNA polymerase sigma factor